MRTLDQIYWDSECDGIKCHCKNLEEALLAHPRLKELRDGASKSLSLRERCPVCGALLHPSDSDGLLLLYCQTCGYDEAGAENPDGTCGEAR